MKKDKPRHIVVCTRVRDLDQTQVVSGSSRNHRCDICDKRVWTSPSTRKMRALFTNYRCMQCASDTHDSSWVPTALSAEQMAEVLATLGKRKM